MKTNRIKIKLTFYFVAKYLFIQLKKATKNILELKQLIEDIYSKMKRDAIATNRIINDLRNSLAIEREYNLNVRIRRRNRFWRRNRKN